MQKVYIKNLMLEVTRRCNMACPHCLRGEAQDMDVSFAVLENLLARVDGIRELVFTGGEPSLNPDAMLETLRLCRIHHIPVHTVWIATNGRRLSDRFIKACHKWNAYTVKTYYDNPFHKMSGTEILTQIMKDRSQEGYVEREYGCYTTVSLDMFHEELDMNDLIKLLALPNPVADKVHIENDPYDTRWVIGEGRAVENGIAEPAENSRFGSYAYSIEETGIPVDEGRIEELYVSCDGSLLKNCDYSYENMKRFARGKIINKDWLDNLIDTGCAS